MNATVGFLHPGAMGSALASCCLAANRLWVRQGRSLATVDRAEAVGLDPVDTLDQLAAQAEVVISICPPAASTEVARAVAQAGFSGIFVDANAISPKRSRLIGGFFDHYVDASVVGPPPTEPGVARLYVSGPRALTSVVEQLWAGSDLDVRAVGSDAGAASALKMAYAGWTKGSGALLMAVAALAEAEGVADALHDEWSLSQPDVLRRLNSSATRGAPKAWRFAGEMEEIAASMSEAALPAEFHEAAAEVYRRLAGFKDSEPDLDAVISQLLGGPNIA